MLNTIINQLWEKCLNELKKEENILFVENELILPLLNRYNNKMRKLIFFLYCMYLIIVMLLVMIVFLLLYPRKNLI